jgi:hypothetical protein
MVAAQIAEALYSFWGCARRLLAATHQHNRNEGAYKKQSHESDNNTGATSTLIH